MVNGYTVQVQSYEAISILYDIPYLLINELIPHNRMYCYTCTIGNYAMVYTDPDLYVWGYFTAALGEFPNWLFVAL